MPERRFPSRRASVSPLIQGREYMSSAPMSAYVEQSFWIVRWEASALSMSAGLSLLLAAVGLYGVISYHGETPAAMRGS
jgi:hypothetical protein